MTCCELLTVEQVSQKLSIGPHAVRRWLREGYMRGYRLPGGDWRIRPEDAKAVLDANFEEDGKPVVAGVPR